MAGGKLFDSELLDQPLSQTRLGRALQTDAEPDIAVGRLWPGENREGRDGRRSRERRPLQRAAAQRAAGLAFLDEIEDAAAAEIRRELSRWSRRPSQGYKCHTSGVPGSRASRSASEPTVTDASC